MARARSPNRERAFELYKEKSGNITNREIAKLLNEDEKKVAVWKNRDAWLTVVQPSKKPCTTVKKTTKTSVEKKEFLEVQSVIKNADLSDEQRLFCLYYVKSFNATKSYQKAYGCDYDSAMANGCRMLRIDKISAAILKLKQERYSRSFLSEEDIFQKYLDIAFSDITDYVSFGKKELPVPVMLEDETGTKQPLNKSVNAVEFKQSDSVDGSLISEVKQGKDGVSIKLLDKMKALDWISSHMRLATEEQTARIDKLKAETVKIDRENKEHACDFEENAITIKVIRAQLAEVE